MELSNRLTAIANMVSKGSIPADIGTDHGYIPIYLIKTGKCSQAYAMDVNPGPLARAKDHILQEHLEECIELRLSDGMHNLKKGEADAAVIAGMGGALIIHILENDLSVAASMRELILGPQSEMTKVREWLVRHAFHFVDEDMVMEDGKYYPIIKVRYEQRGIPEVLTEQQLRFGPILLQKKHPVLQQFIDFEILNAEKIYEALKCQFSESAMKRKEIVQEEIQFLKKVKCDVNSK